MKYPVHILPNPAYKLIGCDLNGNHFIRIIKNVDKTQIIDSTTGNLKVEHICSPREHISDLSVSLLGVYTENEIWISLTKEANPIYSTYCNPDEDVRIPEFQQDYVYNANNHFWCIPVEKIHNQLFDYTLGVDGQFVTLCQVYHTPMRWNYWHYSIRWCINQNMLEDLEKNEKDKYARKIAHNVRVLFSEYARISVPDYKPLESVHYFK